jgi:transcription antitermination factor NusG
VESTATDYRWFIILTEPQREEKAVAQLIARKFEAFSPMVEIERVIRRYCPSQRRMVDLKDAKGRKLRRKVQEPMFRGYGFIRLPWVDGGAPFDRVKAVDGVSGFLPKINSKGESEPAAVPGAVIEAIRAEHARQLSAAEAASARADKKLKIPFVKGGDARIESGPYADWVGKMSRLSKSGRITLLLSMFGGETAVEIDASQVRAA